MKMCKCGDVMCITSISFPHTVVLQWPQNSMVISARYSPMEGTECIWRNERSRKLRFVNFWISFRGTFHRECMAFLQT